jgi:hypothetical protein
LTGVAEGRLRWDRLSNASSSSWIRSALCAIPRSRSSRARRLGRNSEPGSRCIERLLGAGSCRAVTYFGFAQANSSIERYVARFASCPSPTVASASRCILTGRLEVSVLKETKRPRAAAPRVGRPRPGHGHQPGVRMQRIAGRGAWPAHAVAAPRRGSTPLQRVARVVVGSFLDPAASSSRDSQLDWLASPRSSWSSARPASIWRTSLKSPTSRPSLWITATLGRPEQSLRDGLRPPLTPGVSRSLGTGRAMAAERAHSTDGRSQACRNKQMCHRCHFAGDVMLHKCHIRRLFEPERRWTTTVNGLPAPWYLKVGSGGPSSTPGPRTPLPRQTQEPQ